MTLVCGGGLGGQVVAQVDQVVAWKKRAKRLLEALPDVRGRKELLREHLKDVTGLLRGM